ncbi:hypothetical protein NEOLEDRAFT_1167810 [Neolentinus lepideus HHB14362 ss-1]|uniref:DNA replication regulator Sld3 C-terminal domain-containing protein n=1 Tax=Neolentinus lepideus HHB14362 ss-1 TaxID=1314782 RepID=A0A165UGV1_9AGAM|nr:hypothetical protein NEOLEDRAFT_1167810 [Neolentinus lepideus HHB14362 ss-1]
MSILSYEANLDLVYPLKWTTHKSSSKDLPFYRDRARETPDEYVVRTYLQFLWLPESVMPLQLLVPSLLRVSSESASASEGLHPLRALLDPLLLTSRSCANKYHVEVPQILADEGGSGDIEEGTMWFAVGYEKGDEEEGSITMTSQDAQDNGEEKWKKKWLERMERREVQIQILLYFLLLSLPGPFEVSPTSPKKRKRSGAVHDSPSKGGALQGSAVLESRVESFMDKLSTWQLLSSLDQDDKGKSREKDPEVLDWMQLFCRDIVEPQFKATLPQLIDLLHFKLFPRSPFSSSSRSTSPISRSPSPFSSSIKRSHAGSKGSQLLRSRSLSMSLAEDKTDVVPGRKKLSREVSMSRVFRPKVKPITNEVKSRTKARLNREEIARAAKDSGLGVTLVAATPVKNRTRINYVERRSPVSARAGSLTLKGEEDDDELLLGGEVNDGDGDWDIAGSVSMLDTPTKPKRVK